MGLHSALRSPMRPHAGSGARLARLPRAVFDFTSGKLDPRIAFGRADTTACATRFGSDGLLKVMGVNQFPNSAMLGAVVGVIGAGGVMPNGWSFGNAVTGITKEIVATGTLPTGEAYVDFRVYGTNTSGGTGYPSVYPVASASAALAATGQTWTSSCQIQLLAGSLAGFSGGGWTVTYYTAAGGWLEGLASSAITATLTRKTATKTGVNGTIGRVGGYVDLGVANGASVDITFRVAAPQIEQSAVANDYSPTYGTATSGPRFDYDPATAVGTTGPELVVNGAFDVDASWDKTIGTGAAVQIGGGQCRLVTDASGAFTTVGQVITCAVGKRYRMMLNIKTVAAGAIRPGITGAVNSNPVPSGWASVGPVFADFVATSSSVTVFVQRHTPGLANDVTFDDFSVKELTFDARGLLIEEQRTNLALHCRDFTQAIWGKTDVTPTRNQVGVDGVANTATLMTEGSAGTAQMSQGFTVAAGSTVTKSYILRRGNTDWVRIALGGPSLTNGCDAWFNLATGEKGNVVARGAGTANASAIVPLGGGNYRCSVTTQPDGTYTAATHTISSAAANGNYTRVAGATYIADFSQFEVGAFATSSIITGAATATRAADSASVTGTNFSSWFNSANGAFVGEFDYLATASASGAFMEAGSGTSNGYILYKAGGTNNITAYAGTNNSGPLVVSAPNTTLKVAVAYDGTSNAGCANGGVVSPIAVASVANPVQLLLGSWYGNSRANCHIRRVSYYPTRLPNATLKALTS